MTKRNLAFATMALGLIGLAGHVEYSGWVLFVGILLTLD